MQYYQRNWTNSGTTSGKACLMIVKIPHSLAPAKEPVRAIDLHVFGDTSGTGTAAAVYAVVHQDSSTNQDLLTAKARLAKKGPTIPRVRTRAYPYGSQSCPSFPRCPRSFYISVLTAVNRIKRLQKRRCSRHTYYTLGAKIENALAADVF